MIQETPTRLTIDGVSQIVNRQDIFNNQTFIMQIFSIRANYLEVYYSQLSDGFFYINCELGEKMTQMVVKGQLLNNSIIKLTLQDCQVTIDSANKPTIKLNSCQVIKPKHNKAIGLPLHFNIYKEMGGNNPDGSNLIEDGPTYLTIKEVIANTKIKNAKIKGIIFKVPSNISRRILNFRIKDCNGDEIQCVCFDEVAEFFFKQLKEGQQYTFSKFAVQDNKKSNEKQLRFRQIAGALQNVGQRPNSIEILKNNLSSPYRDTSSFANSQGQQDDDNKIWTKRQILAYKNANQKIDKERFNLCGEVTFLKPMNNNRKVNIIDKYNEKIDILLWSQNQYPVIMGKIYKFSNLQYGEYGGYLEMKSTKQTLIQAIDQNQWKNMYKAKTEVQKIYRLKEDPPIRVEKSKWLNPQSKVVDLSDVIKLSEQQNLEKLYSFAQCFLKIRMDSLRFNDSDGGKFFSFYCKLCESNVQVSFSDNDVLLCSGHNHSDIQIKWNLNVKAMDFHNQIPCSIQNQATEAFLNKSAREGYLLYKKDKTDQFQKLLCQVNFEYRVCKFQIRRRDNGNTYFNILQVYQKSSKISLQKAHSELLKKMEEYKAAIQTNKVE